MTDHTVVSGEQWLEARKELLAKEKEFTRLRDELTNQFNQFVTLVRAMQAGRN